MASATKQIAGINKAQTDLGIAIGMIKQAQEILKDIAPVANDEPVFTLAQIRDAFDLLLIANGGIDHEVDDAIKDTREDVCDALRGANRPWIIEARQKLAERNASQGK